MKKIYLDYASLTPTDSRVIRYTKKFNTMEYSNPSALHTSGVMAKKAMNEAREKIADILHAHSDEIIFTGSGTEANNIALQGVIGNDHAGKAISSKHIIVSAIEHSSIIETARFFEKKGMKVSYIPVNQNGVVDLEILKKSITVETILVSIMMVNNEIGTIEPIHEIAKIVRDAGKQFGTKIIFHSDACQAPLYQEINLEKLGVDLLTLDSHKIYGPKGMGMLYIRRGIKLDPVLFGGGQEKGLRPGTENVPGIVGFAYAMELADKMRDKEAKRINEIKNYFISEITKINPQIKVNDEKSLTSPHILNISIPNIDNEFFLLQLDAQGIECSTKSACLRDEDESYVLKSIGVNSANTIRFSFGRETQKSDIKKVMQIIKKILAKT